MCIALHKPAGKVLPRSTYLNCFNSNRDGAGFVYAENGKLHVQKGFFDFEEFMTAISPHEERELVVHFRIGTSAKLDEFNCHPWLVTDCHQGFEFAVVHNGVLSYPHSDQKSDTGHFVDEILGPQLKRDPWFLGNNSGVFLTEQFLGSYNKMIVMRNDGEVVILNRKAGVMEDGVWYSNSGFRERASEWVGYFHGRGYPSYASNQHDRSWPTDVYDDEDRMLYAPQSRVLDASGNVTVPSDLDDETPKRRSGGTSVIPHLTRAERKAYFELAQQYYGQELLTAQQLVERVRDAYIDAHPDKAGLPVEVLDREIAKISIKEADDILV